MWKSFDRTTYDRASFAVYINGLTWDQSWVPKGVTLHNTGAPTLAQWVELGPGHDQRILNLQSYYETGQHWHAGPHFFVGRSHINGFSNIKAPGVHASCFNKDHLGMEMAGDFSTEAFDSGDGSMVRDMAVFGLATLFKKLKLDPHVGLNCHLQCTADHHACPGKNVDRINVLSRVIAAMS